LIDLGFSIDDWFGWFNLRFFDLLWRDIMRLSEYRFLFVFLELLFFLFGRLRFLFWFFGFLASRYSFLFFFEYLRVIFGVGSLCLFDGCCSSILLFWYFWFIHLCLHLRKLFLFHSRISSSCLKLFFYCLQLNF